MKKQTQLLTFLLALFLLSFTVACATTTHDDSSDDRGSGLSEDDHVDGAEEAEHNLVPNNGAAIQIISPADGAVFNSSDNIVVEVEVTNFTLGEDGNHWHVSVDGANYAMITGIAQDTVLRGLEPGEHTITVAMSNGLHQDLEDGDAITIEVR